MLLFRLILGLAFLATTLCAAAPTGGTLPIFTGAKACSAPIAMAKGGR